MTRNDLACVHEPFGDAFYYGPERMSTRFEGDSETRDGSGFATSTYKTIFDRLEREGEEVRLSPPPMLVTPVTFRPIRRLSPEGIRS
jgi:hypothetical protein